MSHRQFAVGAAIGLALALSSCEASTPRDTRYSRGGAYAPETTEPRMRPAAGTRVVQTPAPREMRPASRTVADSELVGITDTLSRGWIEHARVAQSRASDPQVKDFASMELENHGAQLRKQSQLLSELRIDSVRTPLQESLGAESTRWTGRLLAADAASFDRVYLEHLSQTHRDAVLLIDERVLPRVQNAELRALVEEYRSQIQAEQLRVDELLELNTPVMVPEIDDEDRGTDFPPEINPLP